MTPKLARKLFTLICVALGISMVLCIVTGGTFWLFVMLGLALAILYVATESLRCPHCNKRLRLAPIQFCPHCGKKLDDSQDNGSDNVIQDL